MMSTKEVDGGQGQKEVEGCQCWVREKRGREGGRSEAYNLSAATSLLKSPDALYLTKLAGGSILTVNALLEEN